MTLVKTIATGLVIAMIAVPASADRLTTKYKGISASGQFTIAGSGSRTKAEPGYPTPGKAAEACGGLDNVFVVYVESPFGSSEHRYDCAD